MRKHLFLLLILLPLLNFGQQLKLVKGSITDDIVISDSLQETMAIYLPTNFDTATAWPVVFVMETKERAKRAMGMFMEAAEREGYILVGSNNIKDSLSLSYNILTANRMLNEVYNMLPIAKNRVYVAGFGNGARFASVMPTFIRGINGVISLGAAMANLEVLDIKKPFYFIAIVGRSDYSYPEVLAGQKILDKMKFPNQVLCFEGGHEWPKTDLISEAFSMFTLDAMAKGWVQKNERYIGAKYKEGLVRANNLYTQGKPILVDYYLNAMQRSFASLTPLDSLKYSHKIVRKSKLFKTNIRKQSNYFLNESFLKGDYQYYLEEDIVTYNYDNLGWWNYQMNELDDLKKSSDPFKSRMGIRLRGYVNALIEDHINAVLNEKKVDNIALNFLYMLKTITEPTNYDYYLRIISNSAKMEDYGTALFYLEELLKNGYKDKENLYTIDNTALLRITPEYNALVAKYLKDAKYQHD